jgi:hypothetical protein
MFGRPCRACRKGRQKCGKRHLSRAFAVISPKSKQLVSETEVFIIARDFYVAMRIMDVISVKNKKDYQDV